jgi:hypothetical protein
MLEHITILPIRVTTCIIVDMHPARQRPYRGEIHGQKQLRSWLTGWSGQQLTDRRWNNGKSKRHAIMLLEFAQFTDPRASEHTPSRLFLLQKRSRVKSSARTKGHPRKEGSLAHAGIYYLAFAEIDGTSSGSGKNRLVQRL